MKVTAIRSITYALFGTIVVMALLRVSDAEVMSSSHFKIESDSVNVGGGNSSSTNYVQESTVGEVATGISSSTNYQVGAGFQQMQETYIAMRGGGSVTMGPSIPGVTGGTATGSTAVNVVTDSPAGYQLTIAAANSPAMKHGADTIADYVPATSTPDFTFTITAADAYFGFSPKGSDVVNRFRDNGSSCGVGSLTTVGACWDGLSLTGKVIAQGAASNVPSGATTTINFKVGIGGSVVQPPGTYVATTTVTALAL